MAATIDQARAAKEKVKDLIAADPGLTSGLAGIGIHAVDDGYGVKVNLHDSAIDTSAVPASLDGVPIQFDIVGHISKR
jgi:hypothetical protein